MRVVHYLLRFVRIEMKCQSDPIGVGGFFTVVLEIVLTFEGMNIPFGSVENVRDGKAYLKPITSETLADG